MVSHSDLVEAGVTFPAESTSSTLAAAGNFAHSKSDHEPDHERPEYASRIIALGLLFWAIIFLAASAVFLLPKLTLIFGCAVAVLFSILAVETLIKGF